MYAELSNRMGNKELALSAIREAHADALRLEEKMWLAEIHRIEGEINCTDAAHAERCFRNAMIVAQEQGARSFELRATIRLARLTRDKGLRSEALRLLMPIYDSFTEGFDTPDLVEANELAGELQ